MGYLGAKTASGVFQKIIALMPPHDTYIEAFRGTAAVFTRKAPALRSILVERDPDLAPIVADVGKFEAVTGCALEYLSSLDVRQLGRVLIYADPPYVLSTRTSEKRYRFEFSDADHGRLAVILARLAGDGAAVMVSGYPSPLYDGLYAGWFTREFQAMTRGGVRTEKLWLSFEPGAAHWSTYAGRNFTDRQRIKRKAARWAVMFAKLPPGERQAILAALLTVGTEPSSIDAADYPRSRPAASRAPRRARR